MPASDTIRAAYAAFGRGDIPAVLDTMTDDIVWTVPPVDGWGGTFTGKADVLGFFAGLPDRYGQWNLETEEYLEAGDRLVVLGHHSFADGDRVPFAHAWTLQGDRAARFEEYVDNVALGRHVVGTPVG